MFKPKIIAIKDNKDIDFMRVYELVGSLQTYEMTLLNSQKPKESAFRVSKNFLKKIENPKGISKGELAHMVKRIK